MFELVLYTSLGGFSIDVRLEDRRIAHYRRSDGVTVCLWVAKLSIDTFSVLDSR